MLTLDCVGLLCPAPIHLTARKLAGVPAGTRLAIICDDEVITQDLPSWCRLTGHVIVAYRREGARHQYIVQKIRTDGV